jgi:hypothetical protein
MRPVGARGRFSQRFISDLADAWNEYGATALARTAQEYPDRFVGICARRQHQSSNSVRKQKPRPSCRPWPGLRGEQDTRWKTLRAYSGGTLSRSQTKSPDQRDRG